MKKLLTTLTLILGLAFGATMIVAVPASADGPDGPTCQPADDPNCETPTPPCEPADPNCAQPVPPCDPAGPDGCPDPNARPSTGDSTVAALWARVFTAEQTANDYRLQVIALKAQAVALRAEVAKVQAVAERRAATIHRLRAKIRALR